MNVDNGTLITVRETYLYTYMQTPSAIYDTIGTIYNATRRADPYITGRMLALLSPVPAGTYLDVGCGTANYLAEFSVKGYRFYGVDASEVMLQQARQKNTDATFIHAGVEKLPLPDDMFYGATAMFTFHHWTDKVAGLREIYRVLKPGGRLVFLTFSGEQMRGYWLNRYFPRMMQRSWELVPEETGMRDMLTTCGFKVVDKEDYSIRPDLQDHFLYANKYRPEMYLRPEVRQNASSFSAFCEPEELEAGLRALQTDIETGEIQNVMREYENDGGDYYFLVAEK